MRQVCTLNQDHIPTFGFTDPSVGPKHLQVQLPLWLFYLHASQEARISCATLLRGLVLAREYSIIHLDD